MFVQGFLHIDSSVHPYNLLNPGAISWPLETTNAFPHIVQHPNHHTNILLPSLPHIAAIAFHSDRRGAANRNQERAIRC